MGLDDTFWELQWHSGKGRSVRRLVLTLRWLRRALYATGALAVIVLVVVALAPLSLKSAFSSFTVDAVRRENRARRNQSQELHDQLATLAARVSGTVDRARRLAWALRVPEAVWRPGLPVLGSDDEALVSWLDPASTRLLELAAALEPARVNPVTALLSLPLASPVGQGRAVPVGIFGWQASPFGGRLMASRGVTWACPKGEPVLAPGAGTVAYAGTPQGRAASEWMRLGTVVVLDHGGGVLSVLGYLQDLTVRRGQSVRRGQRLGSAGQGGWTKVPAVYCEVRWPLGGSSKPIDPSLLMVELPVADLGARLADPLAGLADDFPPLEALLGRKR